MVPRIVHIVRNFGLNGGMEAYVWRLVNGLAKRNYRVTVVCEESAGNVDPMVDLLFVDKAPVKPRWRSMLTFRQRANELIKQHFTGQAIIIHSHERSILHHVTTFHGPPICDTKKVGFIWRLSPRIKAWKRMEYHELFHPGVQFVLPVSSLVSDTLTAIYPEFSGRRVKLAWPGVSYPQSDLISSVDDNHLHPRFIFVGKEWKRKGLDLAVHIVSAYRQFEPNATLDVFGINDSHHPKYKQNHGWLSFRDWSSSIPWKNYRALIHPANNEPFGMVIAEARAHGLAVLMSDRVGAADLKFGNTEVVSLSRPPKYWAGILKKMLERYKPESEVKWSWDDLIELHCNDVYPRVIPQIMQLTSA